MADNETLKAENARLAARVAELETQLAAKPPIDRMSLYRMVNNAPWGIVVINDQGLIDYANPAVQRWLVRPAPAMGERHEAVLAPALLAVLSEPLPRALKGEAHQADLRVMDATGQDRDVRLNLTPRGAGPEGVTGVVVSLYDMTETTALDRAARENEGRLAHITAVTPTVIYIFDIVEGAPVWAVGRTTEVYGHTAEDLIAGGGPLSLSLVHPDDVARISERVKSLAARPDGEVHEFELRIRRADGSYRWILDRAVAFERSADGRVTKTLSAAIDIDERKRAEERRGMLINELNHRVKNTLAAVQSIARQTLRSDRPIEQTVDLFTARLVALSAAHDVLTRESWQGAPLKEIAEGALRPFVVQGEARITIAGPELRMGARAALALAMALHELAMNAAKYGALSNEAGTIALTWSARDAHLDLEWRESDGPPVTKPERTGFGTRLITQGLRADLDGGAELDFAPGGLICRITAPLDATPQLELA